MNLSNSNPSDIARAMIEGMLSGLADAVQALVDLGVDVKRILIIGGAAKIQQLVRLPPHSSVVLF